MGLRVVRRPLRPAHPAGTVLASQGCQAPGPIKEAGPAKSSSREAFMDRPGLATLRRFARRLWSGLPLLALGCASESASLAPAVTARAAPPDAVKTQPPLSPGGRGVGGEGEKATPKELPIGLD